MTFEDIKQDGRLWSDKTDSYDAGTGTYAQRIGEDGKSAPIPCCEQCDR